MSDVLRGRSHPKPRLLDLFCKAGGAGYGYHLAGFDVVGVDIEPQPRYPFEFHQADALTFPLEGFDAIHASPPCQAYSIANRNNGTAPSHPRLIEPVRDRLDSAGVPYAIENVMGAPLFNAVMICGAALGLGVPGMDLHRHRLFELNVPALGFACARHNALSIGVYGNGTPQWHRAKLGRNVLADEWRAAMGIPWMVKTELSQAIPPAYTEHIGAYLMAAVRDRAAAVVG